MPEISVLMPVYNSERYLREAIESILNQTFQDFEFVIINDGSTDLSEQIILSYKSEKIKYYKNDCNIGLINTLNRGIALCNGEFIARMDADDISLPERLQIQIDFLRNNPQFVLAGGNIERIDTENQHIMYWDYFIPSELIKTILFFRCTFAHPAVMAKKSVLAEFQYNLDYIYAEDYFLWSEIAFKYPTANINETLIKYRYHQQSISVQKKNEQQKTVEKIYAYHLAQLNIFPTPQEIDLHYKLLREPAKIRIFNKNERKILTEWVKKLLKQNEILKVYDEKYFSEKIKYRWSFWKKLHIVFMKIRDKIRNK